MQDWLKEGAGPNDLTPASMKSMEQGSHSLSLTLKPSVLRYKVITISGPLKTSKFKSSCAKINLSYCQGTRMKIELYIKKENHKKQNKLPTQARV